jgi:hypothetical protein
MAISKIGSKALVDCSVAAVDIEDNSITSAKLAGSIANAKLANSSITVNGTSVSLGASGSIPAVSWQSVVTADGSTATSAVASNGYFIDTTSNAHTINLPGSPSAGDTIAIKDYAGTFGTNNLTIGRNGNNIQGVANDSLISTNRASIILVYSDATKGWLYTVESNVQNFTKYVTATGGTITTSGDYKIHTFTGDGCFVVSCGGNPAGSDSVDYLVVAGGGGGGGNDGSDGGAGGGGAGGYRESSGTASGCYTVSPLGACVAALPVSASTYPITVGGGGSGGASCGPNPGRVGATGSNSIFSTITSTGGGGGGAKSVAAGAGGSGGGFSNDGGAGCGGAGNTPPVSPPQGNTGGSVPSGGGNYYAAGGGGATAVGQAGNGQIGAGGAGGTNSINTTPTGRAGGGGGSGPNTGTAPSSVDGGGAGRAGQASGNAGTANTGGGGGAAGGCAGGPTPNSFPGGSGGKGIVIIRYKYQN